MWFKNLSLLRLPADFSLSAEPFELALAEHPLRSPGPLELETRGFLSPFSRDDAALSHGSHDALLFCLGTESRMLPISVLRDAVAERVKEHEAKTGRKPGKRLRNDIREAALGELLPRAFIKRARVGAYFDASSRLQEAYIKAYSELLLHVVIHAPGDAYFAPPDMVEALKFVSQFLAEGSNDPAERARAIAMIDGALIKAGA